ncbi:hypothetical protein [Streptomyces rishiriensis]|uniref:Uncharacterized protein n=1 Tax=Streptomyces rishiriensis TaxID=68264 RepID=A0ABU0P342_STRRH|nr:hypothetical protein [Streptomyces rishiriensis]MDQ0585827.1 hypothetical protein [Streptomyces rishiriensis]
MEPAVGAGEEGQVVGGCVLALAVGDELRLKDARRRGEVTDEETWRRTAPALRAERGLRCLRGLPDRVVAGLRGRGRLPRRWSHENLWWLE